MCDFVEPHEPKVKSEPVSTSTSVGRSESPMQSPTPTTAATAPPSSGLIAGTTVPSLTQSNKLNQTKRRFKKEEEDEEEGEEDESEEQKTVKSERSSKRVKREVKVENMEEENEEDESMEESKERSSDDDAEADASVPERVNSERVRIQNSDGSLVPLDGTPWRAIRSATSFVGPSSSSENLSVVYWMTRDQRVEDNWSLLYAQEVAKEKGAQIRVIFCLVPKYLEATERQYSFMLEGLKEVEIELRRLHIPFEVLIGFSGEQLPPYVAQYRAGIVVTDFDPLRISKNWTNQVATELAKSRIPLIVVDSHNIVPIWIASDKLEYSARTIRPRITRRLREYLNDFPRVQPAPANAPMPPPVDWNALNANLDIDRRVKPVATYKPGTAAAFDMLHSFIRTHLHHYATKRNDPNADHVSGLSPYLHFGQIAPQRCALEVRKYRGRSSAGVNSFIEELIIRRELSDNYCYYNGQYDSIDGASAWARSSLLLHANDPRPFLYTVGELEFGVTDDELWNAAQLQMVTEGKMHGFMRMYWAKKILEWSPTPQMALSTAIYLNDRYSLDGCDPNGYVGCAWSILGTHDVGWKERPVFGKIRYMNYNGCKRKFDVKQFIDKYAQAGSKVGSDTFRSNQQRALVRDGELQSRASIPRSSACSSKEREIPTPPLAAASSSNATQQS